ncbi:MAG: hypothetical protein DHS20C02_05380 [Micavibrio sp.]|nr:MAG: hypothetical protein DHS20C02_05380 [Micavibrio sp.]
MTMAIGTGLPALDLSNIAQSLLGRSSSSNNLQDRGRDAIRNPGHPDHHLGDQINLSEAARNILSTLESGFASQRQQDAQFASQQLQAVQEQIEFASALLGAASDDQQGIILDLINDIIGGLSEAGGAIGDLFGGGLEGLFNSASQSGGDLSVSYAESLNVEFNFTRISERTESIEISEGDDGSVTIERNVTETEIVVTELNIEREQTLVVQQNDDGGRGRGRGHGNSDLRGLVNEFRDTIRQFASLISDVQDRFSGGNDLAETLTNLVRELLQGQEESDDHDGSPLLVDIAA